MATFIFLDRTKGWDREKDTEHQKHQARGLHPRVCLGRPPHLLPHVDAVFLLRAVPGAGSALEGGEWHTRRWETVAEEETKSLPGERTHARCAAPRAGRPHGVVPCPFARSTDAHGFCLSPSEKSRLCSVCSEQPGQAHVVHVCFPVLRPIL